MLGGREGGWEGEREGIGEGGRDTGRHQRNPDIFSPGINIFPEMNL